jgi:RNA polymerase sigma-70 factor, ECF subfamily
MREKEEIMNQLVNKYSHKLTKFAFKYIRDQQLAEDIVQDVFMKCCQHFDQFRGGSSIETWLYKITFNQCMNYLRSSHFKRTVLTEHFDRLIQAHTTPELKVMEQLDKEELIKKVSDLPKIYKEVIVLFYLKHLSLKEIQEFLQINLSTVKVRLHRAKYLLRMMYSE